MAKEVKYTTIDDLFKGFSNSQIEQLMKNMTIFQPMDWCVSSFCNVCAYEANKETGTAMKTDTIRKIVQEFKDDFNKNRPENHAFEQLGYRGENGENYGAILRIYEEFLDYMPRVTTSLPNGTEEVFWEILNMKFKRKLDMFISQQEFNYGHVNNILRFIEEDSSFIEKESLIFDGKGYTDYFIETEHGTRSFSSVLMRSVPVGRARQLPVLGVMAEYEFCQLKGVAVMPTGFYNYDPMEPTFHSLMNSKITPEKFNMKEKENYFSTFVYDARTQKGEMIRSDEK